MLLAAMRGYKRYISPLRPASCRFTPTCSEYAAEAIARHGALVGSALAAWRLLRCNPLTRGGLDLVPTRVIHTHHSQPDDPACSIR